MIFPYRLIDFTHTLSETSPSWNGSCGFEKTIKLDYEQSDSNVQFRVHQLKLHAGIGTHLDAPAHCIINGKTVDELDIKNLILPFYIMDVSNRVDEHYSLPAEEIKIFKKENNLSLKNAFIGIKTGWQKFWNHPSQYRNNYCFPNISKEAAEYMLQEGVQGIGIDTLSPDIPSSGFPVHDIFLKNNKYIVENMFFPDNIPQNNGYILIAPLKAKGCTEAPIRLIGFF